MNIARVMNKSTIKTLEVIELLAKKGELTISQIAKDTNVPRSSIDDIVRALVFKGYLNCNEGKKAYYLSNKIMEIALSVKDKRELLDVVAPFLQMLAAEFNDTIFFALKDNDDVLYLSKLESTKAVRTTAVLGSRKSLYYTGLGKAILSTFSDSELNDYFERTVLEPKTEFTITSKTQLRKDVRDAGGRGYAIDNREGDVEVACVAAPVFSNGKILGAVSIAGLYINFNENEICAKGKRVKEVAEQISFILK